jgi:hypothetical protein
MRSLTAKPDDTASLARRSRRAALGTLLVIVLVSALVLVQQFGVAWRIGVAYRYGLPLFEVMRLRYTTVYDEYNPHRVPFNTLLHKRNLVEAGEQLVTAPNNDTLYSLAVLDLSAGPVRLEVPDTGGRYYSAALMDAYTNNFSVIGRRTTGTHARSFIITAPGWELTEPANGAQLIHCPTPTALLLLRIVVDGPDDLPAVRQLQNGFRLTGPARHDTDAAKPPMPILGDPMSFIAVVNRGLADNPPPAADAQILKRIAGVGIAPGAGPPTPALATQWLGFLPLQQRLLAWVLAHPRHLVAGWNYPPSDIGNFGTDYAVRAAVALFGLLALPPEEAAYSSALHDAHGRALNGAHRYRLKLPPGGVPVDAFWSLSMYQVADDGRLYFTSNPLHRYAIGDRTAGLKKNQDGSIDILIQHDSPGAAEESNWLPAPAGAFRLMMRAYQPRRELLDGQFRYPGVERVEGVNKSGRK